MNMIYWVLIISVLSNSWEFEQSVTQFAYKSKDACEKEIEVMHSRAIRDNRGEVYFKKISAIGVSEETLVVNTGKNNILYYCSSTAIKD